MNKYLLLLILSVLSFGMVSCDDDEDVTPIDIPLIAGTWEVVDQGNQNVFEREFILNITSSQIHEGYGGYKGYITILDRVFTWSCLEVENHQPLLEVVFQGELDSDDPWAGDHFYKITKLNDSHMWWQVNTKGDNSTIKFKRRTDLQIE